MDVLGARSQKNRACGAFSFRRPAAPKGGNALNGLVNSESTLVLVTVQVPDHVDARPVLTRKVRNSLKTRLFGLLESSVQRHPGPPDCAMLPTDKTKNI
jgi:hypothetical protein